MKFLRGKTGFFWLADEPALINGAEHIVQYAKGKSSSNTSWILPAGQNIFAPVDLYTAVIEKILLHNSSNCYGKMVMVTPC